MNEETQLPPGYISELSTTHADDVLMGTDTASVKPASNYWLAQELFTILRLIRVDKPLASAVFLFSGIYVVGGLDALISFTTLRAAVATVFIVASCFALNDVQDVVADRANKPNRPIPSGQISRRYGVIISSVFAIGGIAMAATLGLTLIVFSIIMVALSISYSYWLKGTPLFGNALIGVMISSILIYGALAVGHITLAIVEGCILTFLYTFSTEILFTIRDAEADQKAGLHTVAVMFGRERAFGVFQLATLSVICCGVILWLLGYASNAFILTATGCIFVPIILILFITRNRSQLAIQTATFWVRRVSLLSFIPILLLR
jgi:geranylgeranylglycerol-phosphate geranylgeranyltransferase